MKAVIIIARVYNKRREPYIDTLHSLIITNKEISVTNSQYNIIDQYQIL